MIITGFVASTAEGVPTTLKRSGSDFSATIFARLLKAKTVTLWKNIDGVFTADPRRVSRAFSVMTMSYDEAIEVHPGPLDCTASVCLVESCSCEPQSDSWQLRVGGIVQLIPTFRRSPVLVLVPPCSWLILAAQCCTLRQWRRASMTGSRLWSETS